MYRFRYNYTKRLVWPKWLVILLAVVLALGIVFHFLPDDKEEHGEFGDVGSVEIETGGTGEEPSSSSGTESGHMSAAEAEAFLDSIPDYSEVKRPAYAINGNKPEFTDEEFERAKEPFIELSELDLLGRCGTCTASIGKETLASDRDFDLSHVTPTGWKQERYEDLVDNGGWIYNRCHLLAFCLTGLRDDRRNLITGTRYMNDNGMLQYSELANLGYINKKLPPGEHILYRVTPVFRGFEFLCRGVHIEAADTATKGEAFHINVFCYNVQPGIEISYSTGDNWRE